MNRLMPLFTVITLLVAPTFALAGTTLGQIDPGSPSSGTCYHTLAVQTDALAGTPLPVAPFNGVITRMSTNAQAGSGQVVRFYVLEPSIAPNIIVRSRSDEFPLMPGVVNSFDVRMSIKAGDVIGLYSPGDVLGMETGIECVYAVADVENAVSMQVLSPTPEGGAIVDTSVNHQTSFRVNLAAVLEADLDGDGYGAETQDTCDLSKYTHLNPCCPNGTSARVMCTHRTGGGFREIGSAVREVLVGTGRADELIGSGGPDSLHPRGGRDIVNGGRGADKIYAGDTRADSINCGPGNDVVWADRRKDNVHHCEVVHWIG